jgi:hypothetical protein
MAAPEDLGNPARHLHIYQGRYDMVTKKDSRQPGGSYWTDSSFSGQSVASPTGAASQTFLTHFGGSYCASGAPPVAS